MVHVELVYAPKDKDIICLKAALPLGALVKDALIVSGIYELCPETKECVVGIYSRMVTLDTPLREGDRIELYRALALDPKEKRRQLAKVKKG
jgi:putative ubiquitin-RnfH superfamily antitoxin RatB of RatAB toxin-antitoxin module